MDRRCEQTRELAAELALGVADGEERGRALQHLAECQECRAEVERLSDVADELLLLAPRREAPVGFESRVLAQLLPAPAPKRRRRRRLVLALAPIAAAVAAVALTLAIVSDDLDLASDYRQTLEEADGQGFYASPLQSQDGAHAGTVFSYIGSPNWMLITVNPAHRPDLRAAELVMEDGSQVPLRWFDLDRSGSSGGGVAVDLHHVSVLRLLPGPGGELLVARFGG